MIKLICYNCFVSGLCAGGCLMEIVSGQLVFAVINGGLAIANLALAVMNVRRMAR